MTGKYHSACAVTTGIAASALYVLESGLTMETSIGAATIVIASSVAGLMPDIDLPSSTVGKVFKPIARMIKKAFGHRTLTHSGLWLIPLLILLFQTNWHPLLIGISIGFLSHIVSDTMTSGGIPWLYPLSKKRIRLTPIDSGRHDFVLTVLASGLIISGLALYYMLKHGLIAF